MRTQQLLTLLKRTSLLKDFLVQGKLLYLPIQSPMLRGLYFNDSGFDSSAFYLLAFVQPLYVPSDTIDLTLATEIRSPEGLWTQSHLEIDPERLEASVRHLYPEFVAKFGSPEPFAKNWHGKWSKENPHVLRAAASTELLLQNWDRFHSLLEQAKSKAKDVPGNPPWVMSLLRDLEEMKNTAQRNGEAVRQMLVEAIRNQIVRFKLRSDTSAEELLNNVKQ